jgi:hypothetical protein
VIKSTSSRYFTSLKATHQAASRESDISTSTMRLLHVKTQELEEFYDTQVPEYAILSHCSRKEEVTFQDINGRKPDPSRSNILASRLRKENLRTFGLINVASSNVDSTNNALQYRWHLPPYTAAGNPSIRKPRRCLGVIFQAHLAFAYLTFVFNPWRDSPFVVFIRGMLAVTIKGNLGLS